MANVVNDGGGVDAGGVNEGGTETALASALVVDGITSGVVTLEAAVELVEGMGVDTAAAMEEDVDGNAAGLLAGGGEPDGATA